MDFVSCYIFFIIFHKGEVFVVKKRRYFLTWWISIWDSMYLDIEKLSMQHRHGSQYDEYHLGLPVLLHALCKHQKLHVNHYQAVAGPANTNFSKKAKWFGTCSKQLYSTDWQDHLNKKQNKENKRKKPQFAIKTLHMCSCYSAVTETWSTQSWILLSLFIGRCRYKKSIHLIVFWLWNVNSLC